MVIHSKKEYEVLPNGTKFKMTYVNKEVCEKQDFGRTYDCIKMNDRLYLASEFECIDEILKEEIAVIYTV